MKKINEIGDLREWALENVWTPLRPWDVLTAPEGFTTFTQGNGCRVRDIEGNEYLDFASGMMVNFVGYGRKEIADAAYDQMLRMQFTPTHDLCVPKIKLAKKLADITPGSLSKVFFGLSGQFSIETAIKIARKYQQISGFYRKLKIIGSYAYHGFTYGAASAGWHGNLNHKDFEPLVPGFVHVASPKCPICDFGLKYPSCNVVCAKYIEKIIQKEIPETVAAFLDVPVSTHGYVPPPEYWPIVRSICDKYGMLLIHDEVMSGFGRTGKMFACEHWNIVPDIMVVAKGLAGGYMPISAAIVTKEVARKFEGGANEVLLHSVSFEGHPPSCAAALTTLEIIEREKLVENAEAMGKYLFKELQSLRKYRIVGQILGGLGLLAAVELVRDSESGEPFSPEENKRVQSLLKGKLMKAGLFGQFGNPILISPPLIVSEDEIDQIMRGLDKVIGEIEKEFDWIKKGHKG